MDLFEKGPGAWGAGWLVEDVAFIRGALGGAGEDAADVAHVHPRAGPFLYRYFRVGAELQRREREQKRSGGEGGSSRIILVQVIKTREPSPAARPRLMTTGGCFTTSIGALRPSNRRLQASEID